MATKQRAKPTARAKGNTANLKPWKKGQSGNPNGRPKGSRDKINEAFLSDFAEVWEQHGKDAMLKVAQADPAASLLPKENNHNVDVGERFLDVLEAISSGRAEQQVREHLGLANSISAQPLESADLRHSRPQGTA
jgi:hypothetical protein